MTVIQRMVKEMYIWWKARHENILPFLGFFHDEHGFMHFVSEWMDNGTLLDYLPNIGRGCETKAVVIVHSYYLVDPFLT